MKNKTTKKRSTDEVCFSVKNVVVYQSDLRSPWRMADGEAYSAYSRRRKTYAVHPEGGFITFDAWKTERFGWCFPTLLIKKAGGRYVSRVGSEATDRTYAISERGELCRIGHGPHIKQSVTVHVRKSRLEALQPILSLIESGKVMAHERRDVLSTRRANSRSWSSW